MCDSAVNGYLSSSTKPATEAPHTGRRWCRSLTDNDVFENVGVVVRCGGHCGSEKEKRQGETVSEGKWLFSQKQEFQVMQVKQCVECGL